MGPTCRWPYMARGPRMLLYLNISMKFDWVMYYISNCTKKSLGAML